jgi:hypothetical protein
VAGAYDVPGAAILGTVASDRRGDRPKHGKTPLHVSQTRAVCDRARMLGGGGGDHRSDRRPRPPSLGHCVIRMTCPPPAEAGLTLPFET